MSANNANTTKITNKFTNTAQQGFKQAAKTYQESSLGMKIVGFIIIILLLALFIYCIVRLTQDYRDHFDNQPWLIYGTKIARSAKKIPGSLIRPSVDAQYGIEFSYTMWIYITDWTTFKTDEYKHIMHKGNAHAIPLQAPGIWLYPRENKLAINMNTYYSVKESCDIGNIPIGKWFHLAVIQIGKNMDVYINGRLKKRCQFKGVPKINYGDLYINQWGGFDGFLSRMRYFNYALPYFKIEQMLRDGPSQMPCTDTGTEPPYLAKDYWMTTGFPDAVGYP